MRSHELLTAADVTRIVDGCGTMTVHELADRFANRPDLGDEIPMSFDGVMVGMLPRTLWTALDSAIAAGTVECGLRPDDHMRSYPNATVWGEGLLRTCNAELRRADEASRALLAEHLLALGERMFGGVAIPFR